MSIIKYNKSKTYLLPLLADVIDMDIKFFSFLNNTYIFSNNDKYKDCIFILHDFSFKNPEFTSYEHKLTNNQYFVDLVDIGNKVLYIFKFPKEYMNEYNNFKIGKYSKFKEDAKITILEFFTNIYQNNTSAINFLVKLKQILYRDRILKKQIETDLHTKLAAEAELTDIINKEDETFLFK